MIAVLKTEPIEGLTQPERDRLQQLETVIQTGLQTFIEVGNALLEIRESRLYRESGTFENYFKMRWGFQKAQAYRLMEAAEVVADLKKSPIGDFPLPTNEAQCRELAKAGSEARSQVWQEAVERTDGKPTAKAVREVVEEWEDTETRYYNTIPLFNRNDLTEVEEKLRTKYSQADDNICPIWDELIPLFELVGQVMEGEAAAKLQLLPTGDRRRKLPAYIVHRPDLGAPFPLLLWTRENAWQYWQQRRDKLVGLAERKPMSNEFADGFKTDVETPHAPIAFTPEPSGEMPREEHPAGVIASASTCEHYTPEWIWKAALEAFDIHAFDLDPSTYAGSPIPCKQRFIREDDGLSQQWEANYLWSNFPYSDVDSNGKILQVMGRWVDKLLSEIDAGRTRQAMTLVKSDCRPEWFQKLLAESTAFCMLAKAVKFDTPDGPGGSSFFGSVVFYFGEDVERFYQVFSPLGVCCQALEPEFMGW